MFFDNYDTPVFRPPSEANSFILRVTRGCAHNKCTYCNMYRGVPFQVLTDEEIARQMALAYSYNRDGVRRVFLADGDALVLSTERLLRILHALKQYFPYLQRVSSYAAPKDILRKTPEELVQLREAGLKLLYYGMESGDSVTLKAVNKGVDGPQSIEAGRRVVEAGMKLSIMIILGIAGVEGSRGSELKEQFERGEFHPLSPGGLMHELHRILEHVELPEHCHTIFRSNHVSNYANFAGNLPKDKERLLVEVQMAAEELDKLKTWDVYNDDRY